eukprot:gene9970-10124_t
MGRICIEYLEGKAYCCKHCHAHLAKCDQLLSKQFHSRNGAAWLFQSATNVLSLPSETRLMTTGVHIVSDISCIKCLQVLGWKYEKAFDESQKYKEGKYILESAHVVETNSNGAVISGSGCDVSSDDDHYY